MSSRTRPGLREATYAKPCSATGFAALGTPPGQRRRHSDERTRQLSTARRLVSHVV